MAVFGLTLPTAVIMYHVAMHFNIILVGLQDEECAS
jgi:hypothetical protein